MERYYLDNGMTRAEGQQAQLSRRTPTALDLALNPDRTENDIPGDTTSGLGGPDVMPRTGPDVDLAYQKELQGTTQTTQTAPATPATAAAPTIEGALDGDGIFRNAAGEPIWGLTPGSAAYNPPATSATGANQASGTTTTPVTPTGQITAATVQPPPVKPTNTAGRELLQTFVNQPYSLSNDIIAKMKEKQKEDTLAMYGQQGEQQMQSMASRGMLDSGMADAYKRSQGDALTAALTSGYRDLDIRQALQRNTDTQQALNAWNEQQRLDELLRQYNETLGFNQQQHTDEMGYRYSNMLSAADIEAWLRARGWGG